MQVVIRNAIFVLLCVCGVPQALGEIHKPKLGLFAKKEGAQAITNFSLFSERCSGSNYLQKLIVANFDITAPLFCHKHFPPWYELPIDHYHGDPRHYTFEGTDDYLFFVIFREPYDWVRSLYKSPWEARSTLRNIPFSTFIRTPWELAPEDKNWIVRRNKGFNPLLERNPVDGSLFKNVMKLRTAKIQTMLQIMYRAKNVYYINYETVRDFPEEVLAEIGSIFNLPSKGAYLAVPNYKGNKNLEIYVPKRYVPINAEDLAYINAELDEPLEQYIGYTLIHDSELFAYPYEQEDE